MKKYLFLFVAALYIIACNPGGGSGTGNHDSLTDASSGKDSLSNVPLPFTAEYSSNFVAGKASDVAAVLKNYKAWQDNDMEALGATFGDSVTIAFSSGYTFSGTHDSLMKMAKLYRDSLSNVSLTFDAWTSHHSVDKNEDWVNVWYKEVDTYKNGKKDSINFEDANQVKDGKIVTVLSYSRKFKKK
ncbi:MAG TPA: hypothetical protein VG890_03705 [Puia sp.]|nr:hypothetical protein [Puia sp.]